MDNFEEIWNNHIKSLEKKKIYSIARNAESEILEVNDRFLVRRSSIGMTGKIYKVEFKRIYDILQEKGQITRKEIVEHAQAFSSFIVAVFAQLPNVRMIARPTTLTLIR